MTLRIEKTIYPNTGIYQRKIHRVELPVDDESLTSAERETFKGLADLLGPPDDALGTNRMESEVTEFLRDYIEIDMGGFSEGVPCEIGSAGWDDLVQTYIGRARDQIATELKKHLSEEEKRTLIRKLVRLERANDACEMLSMITAIRFRFSHADQSSKNAMADAFMFGRTYERFKVRSSEGKASTGNKVLMGASTGGNVAKKYAERKQRKLVADFGKSGLSQRKFSDKYLVPRSTLKRALKAVGQVLR
jgi:hypothetical protein